MFHADRFKIHRLTGAVALIAALSAQSVAFADPALTRITSPEHAATQIVQPSDTVRIRHIDLPDYSNELLRHGVEGVIEVQAHVDADGHVTDALVTRTEPQALATVEQSVLDNVRSATFYPTFEDGKAIDTVVLIPFRFALIDRTVSTFPFKRVAKSRLARAD
jgi:TonB family protein